jgi:hypothetical protein
VVLPDGFGVVPDVVVYHVAQFSGEFGEAWRNIHLGRFFCKCMLRRLVSALVGVQSILAGFFYTLVESVTLSVLVDSSTWVDVSDIVCSFVWCQRQSIFKVFSLNSYIPQLSP